MGAKSSSSHLSDGKYGYDFVVATTQQSINATLLRFLDVECDQEVDGCFVLSDDYQYVPITLDELKLRTDGVNPFDITDQTDPQDKGVQALFKARFVAGFHARIGLPPTDRPDLLKDVITLNQDATQVLFRAMCSEFTVVALQANVYGPSLSWVAKSQPAENPWMFTTNVDLTTAVTNDKDIRNLPSDVQAKIGQLREKTGTTFNVQHLLLALASATKTSEAFIDGLDENSPNRAFIEDAFQEAYFKALAQHGDPLIGCMVVTNKSSSPPSTGSQVLTDTHLMVNPYVGQDGLPVAEPAPPAVKCTTLNYLCSWDGHALPPPHKFSWNWVNMLEMGDYHGVVAINRNWLAYYLAAALLGPISSQCLLLNVQCDRTSGGSVHYGCEFPGNMIAPLTFPSAPDPRVVSLQWKVKDQDQCGAGGSLGQLEVRYEYGMNVSFSGHTITVEQTQLLHVFLQRLKTKKSGDYVKKTLTDTFSVTVDENGNLVAAPDVKAQLVDTSSKIPDDKSIANSAEIRAIVNGMNKMAPLKSPGLENIVLSRVQDFVFPCGNTFQYKKVEFSDYQDLLCKITYVDPGRKVVKAPRRC